MVMAGMAEKREKKRGTNKLVYWLLPSLCCLCEKGVMVSNCWLSETCARNSVNSNLFISF